MDQRWILLAAASVCACSSARVGRTAKGAQPAVVRVNAAVSRPSSSAGNPFEGATYFVNPEYSNRVDAVAKAHPAEAPALHNVAKVPTAIWLDTIERAKSVSSILESAASQAGDGHTPLSVFVVYDLPNRDCSAKASAGELTSEAGGEERYRTQFIDKIAEQFAGYPNQRIVVVLEPDSLPNLATNMSVLRCAQSDGVYRRSIAYAISKLAMPHVSVYMDAAHAGWLGWDGNRAKIAKIFKEVLALSGGAQNIRGFSTNVSNFNTLSDGEGKRLGPSNPCPDELTYVSKLSASLEREGITGKQFIIDTARNGRPVRSSWGNWCNIKNAGIGERPQASPANLIDAYFWIKPPGESDGVSDSKQPRFDTACSSADSAPGAPQAGQWFETYFRELVQNANPRF